MDYMLWRPGRKIDGICRVKGVQGVQDAFELTEGTSRIQGWPEDARYPMDPSFPKDVALADSLYNPTVLLVSARVKIFLEDARVNNVEFLRASVVNHKGRIASSDYYIVNPQDICDCIDIKSSGVQWNDLDPDSICLCDSLVLRTDVIPQCFQMFRLHRWRKLIVIRRELADAMNAADFTGLNICDPANYQGRG